MSTEVRVSYVWTLNEIRRAMRFYPRPFWVWGDWKSCGLILALGVHVGFAIQQVWLSQDIRSRNVVTLVLALPYLAACFMLVRARFTQSPLAGTTDSPDLNHPIRYSFSHDRWVCETQTIRGEFQWSILKAVSRVKEGFIAITPDHQCAWLPIHGFESEVDVETFVGLVKSHDVQYDDRNRSG